MSRVRSTDAPAANVEDGHRGSPDDRAETRSSRIDLGAITALALFSATGLVAVSAAGASSRTGRSNGELLFWVGVTLIFAPILVRLTARNVRRSERIALVVLLGLALYLVKVVRDPFTFTYADELVHEHNVFDILRTGSLFGHNPILTVTPLYPGLEATAAAIASSTGLSTFVAGLILIGVARVVMVLALFFLLEALTGSHRVAGLGAGLYVAAPSFLFFCAQFSYESLALPLAVFAVLAAVRCCQSTGRSSRAWGTVAVVSILAVVATHHLTSYALAAFLVVSCVFAVFQRRAVTQHLVLASVAVAATMAWLVGVASDTVGYLSPVISGAFRATLRTASGEVAPRALFQSTSGVSSPQWEHLTALAAATIVLLAEPLGLLALWRRRRFPPAVIVLGAASIAYIGSLGLRLVPAAWETGARTSEFLFIGVALVLSLAAWIPLGRAGYAGRIGVTVLAVVLFMGGVIAGSSSGYRAARPYRLAVNGTTIDPPAVAAARWASGVLHQGPLAAEEADARVFLVDGREDVIAGSNPDIIGVLQTPTLYRWQLDLLRREGVRYVVIDLRRVSANVASGYFFESSPSLFPRDTVTKFERAGASRVFDNGDIRVDDISAVRSDATT